MKIISKFHDYYDIGLSYGIDPNVVYERKTNEISLVSTNRNNKNEKTKNFDLAKKVFSHIHVTSIMPRGRSYPRDIIDIDNIGCVVFCGYVYPFLNVRIQYTDLRKTGDYNYIYSLNELDDLVNNCDSKQVYKLYYSQKEKFIETRKDYDDYFNGSMKMNYNNLINIHEEYDSPIIVYNWKHNYEFQTIVNPRLADFQFYKVQDAYTAFQNLSMFMSGVLGCKENETLDVSDKDLKHMKGFDEKSFRKESTKKRQI